MVEQTGEPLKHVGILFIMIDGVSDHSARVGENKFETPLQSANVPTLDALASQGVFGVHDPV